MLQYPLQELILQGCMFYLLIFVLVCDLVEIGSTFPLAIDKALLGYAED